MSSTILWGTKEQKRNKQTKKQDHKKNIAENKTQLLQVYYDKRFVSNKERGRSENIPVQS